MGLKLILLLCCLEFIEPELSWCSTRCNLKKKKKKIRLTFAHTWVFGSFLFSVPLCLLARERIVHSTSFLKKQCGLMIKDVDFGAALLGSESYVTHCVTWTS